MAVSISNVQLTKTVTKAIEDYRNGPSQWIADYVAPRIAVTDKTGYLPRFGRDNQKDTSGKVSPSSPSPSVDFNISSTEYECEVYRKVMTLPWELEVFDSTGMLKITSLAMAVQESMSIEREREVGTMLIDTSASVTAQGTPTTKWNKTGGDPIGAIADAQGTIDDAINRIPEYGLCTRDVALYLRQHVAEKRAGGGNAGLASLEEVASYLGLRELRVMRAAYNSAKPGVVTGVGAKVVAANKFWVFHKPENMSMFTPSWVNTPYMSVLNTTDVWDVKDPKGKKVRIGDCRDLIVTDMTACIYIPTPLG